MKKNQPAKNDPAPEPGTGPAPLAACESSLLARLGVIGMEPIEPVVLGALISGEPLLLIGLHGTGKSYLLNRLCAALGLEWRHYNCSLLNYDDLVGYPVPNGQGGLEFVQTPASIWGAQAVFLDEISRCRPDMQNKLYPILHERRVQGIELPRLVYRWAAMNPPFRDEDEGANGYRGSEALDIALADRFAFVVDVPDWEQFGERQKEAIILSDGGEVCAAASWRLREDVASGRALLAAARTELGPRLAGYVRLVAALLRQAGLPLSARRGAFLLRNVTAVHAARLLSSANPDLEGSAYLALNHSIPQRATEGLVGAIKVLTAHREAWQAAALDPDDPLRYLLLESDPLRRALRAARVETLAEADFSAIVADALAALAPGSRHALATALFESGAAGRLLAAVAEQCAQLYSVVATEHSVQETVANYSTRYRVWQRVVAAQARLNLREPEDVLVSNLLFGLFAANELGAEADVDRVLSAWWEAREQSEGVAP